MPSYDELNALITAVGGRDVAGKMLKATSGWNGGGNGTDDYGFSALAAGYRSSSGYMGLGGSTSFWGSTTEEHGGAWSLDIPLASKDVGRVNGLVKDFGHPIRCLKD